METREVLVSPGFGAGWSTWNSEYGQALATDPELVALVKAGKHKGTTPYEGDLTEFAKGSALSLERHQQMMANKCSPEFYERAKVVARELGAPEDWHPYCGGVESLEVRTVSGPFRIDEYDGSESLIQSSEEVWW